MRIIELFFLYDYEECIYLLSKYKDMVFMKKSIFLSDDNYYRFQT